MCFDAKSSISAFWIMIIMALFLWYRNLKYDRALVGFIFGLSLIQLVEYGVHTGADSFQSGRALFLILWLQCFLFAVGVYLYIEQSNNKSSIFLTLACWNLVIFSLVFIIALVLAFSFDWSFSGTRGDSGHIEWYRNNGALLGYWGWLYVIGITAPLVILLGYYFWADIGIAILLIYGGLSACYVMSNYSSAAFSSMWCYLSVGFVFLSWFCGILYANTPCTQ